jgi:hypothetical protein
MPYFHIHGLMAGLMAPLVSGGSVVATGTFDPGRIREWLTEHEPTWYTGVPAMHRAVLDALGQSAPVQHRLRFVRSASSPLAPVLMQELEEVLGVPAIEAYGMTEASHQLATNPLPPAARKPGSVGLASGAEIALLTDGQVHTDADRTGEVIVRGPIVTAGYREGAEANRDAFHDGWFRTGDLGCLDPDGYIRLVGRLKEMINRGGEKISPREIDEVLLGHPTVAQAATFAIPHPTLGEDVAAVVVARHGQQVSPPELMAFAAARLSAYKVPHRVIVADRIPVGPTGKPQRGRMAEQLGLLASIDHEPPQGERSELEALWCECLGLDRVRSDGDFFALGGDSLRSLALISTVEEVTGRTVPLSFFSDGMATLERMEALLSQLDPEPAPASGPVDQEAISSAESGVLAASMLDPSGALYNEPIALTLKGALDLGRLQAALRRVVAAHEGLRTSFPNVDGRPVRAVAPSVNVHVDIRIVDPADDVAAILRSAARRPFDLEHGPLLRASVLVVGPDEHIVMLTAHHSVVDGLARDLLVDAMAAAYRSPLVPVEPTGRPTSIASRQRADLASGALNDARDYWLSQLSPPPTPADFVRMASRSQRDENEGDVVGFSLDAKTSESLHQLARERRTTPFAVFLAALAATLSRLTGATDVVIGTPSANRHRGGATKVIGMLANMLPLRIDVEGDPTFEDLVARARQVTLGALTNQEYPYERMRESARHQSNDRTDALFGVTCQLRPSPPTPDFGAGITASRFPRAHRDGKVRSQL